MEEETKGSPYKAYTASPDKSTTQRVLEDFGFGGSLLRGDGADHEGLGAGHYVNSLDFSDLRHEIKKAINEHDEVALSAAIDVARELGSEYSHPAELDQAEARLMDMMQCPDGTFPTHHGRE